MKFRTEDVKQSLLIHDTTVDDSGQYTFKVAGVETLTDILINGNMLAMIESLY